MLNRALLIMLIISVLAHTAMVILLHPNVSKASSEQNYTQVSLVVRAPAPLEEPEAQASAQTPSVAQEDTSATDEDLPTPMTDLSAKEEIYDTIAPSAQASGESESVDEQPLPKVEVPKPFAEMPVTRDESPVAIAEPLRASEPQEDTSPKSETSNIPAVSASAPSDVVMIQPKAAIRRRTDVVPVKTNLAHLTTATALTVKATGMVSQPVTAPSDEREDVSASLTSGRAGGNATADYYRSEHQILLSAEPYEYADTTALSGESSGIKTPSAPDTPKAGLISMNMPVEVTPPVEIYFPEPRYPDSAKKRGIEGSLQVLIFVEDTGRVSGMEIQRSSGYDMLDQAALSIMNELRYRPGLANGQPIKFAVTKTITFLLEDG